MEKLEQVLINLLSNANKYSPDGSEITLGVRETDGNVIVEVSDQAPAIAEEEKERIFDSYYRITNDGDNNQTLGLGLGLAIARKIVDLHQGKIWVDTLQGGGNTFAFSLPAVYQ